VCGRVHSGWYDRRTRRVRDLPSGPYRIFLKFEVRRVDCKNCQAVKREALDQQYLKAQLTKAGTPGPQRIGIDEISINKRHMYRIVVSDLDPGPADLVRRQGPE
jgi:transposase